MENKLLLDLAKINKKYKLRRTEHIARIPLENPGLIKNETSACSPKSCFENIDKSEHK